MNMKDLTYIRLFEHFQIYYLRVNFAHRFL